MSVTFRQARPADVPLIVAMLADDPIAAAREGDPSDEVYLTAFAAVDADPRQELIVAERNGEVVGTMQITYIPGLSRRGGERALVEAVRVAAPERGRGLGRAMMRWAIDRARERGCRMVQLTSDKDRAEAHRFYGSLGFVDSHVGFKLAL
ncbi:GNAT family acetyltransferase [Sphaerisporangium siamense]|uniref:GNAT superfamily N-acetyltransferase n=1 Tax=Sphaerisporangium siamense TaxID=795645 RepID=A0A7W7D590_9ACTN|nr:GNAT family N-acetyltransferase [Sphaerisporangium siamense]MBB4700407.1 GNAT superfamily N-acetyltransferase [Sphaerisporangium siamense]GII87827.1 GNAT family acetyltransferase [Sphaerisporangium siamense]